MNKRAKFRAGQVVIDAKCGAAKIGGDNEALFLLFRSDLAVARTLLEQPGESMVPR